MPPSLPPPFPGRRDLLRTGAGALLALLAGGCASPLPQPSDLRKGGLPGFAPVPPSAADTVVVPSGYRFDILYPWGEPTGVAGAMPPWQRDAGNSAQDQALQAGMHHDGMHFFPLVADGTRGLLVLNHEYTDENLLHPDGAGAQSLAKVHKSQHACGVSVVEVALGADGRWQQVLPSRYARRIHARTPMRLAGPAAGHAAMRTALDPAGLTVLGTYANCAMGVTPWGTYLTCEENFHGYFGRPSAATPLTSAQRRYSFFPDKPWVDWWRFDERFDLSRHPNESNRFGWVVEIDPFDPQSTPVKRTALGRFFHESATCTLAHDGRVVVYMGDDARFEYIYKFVSRDPMRPGGAAANRDTLDHGTLYAARFDAGGRGQWLELAPGRHGITREDFPTQADVVVRAREAADRTGATPMDRPEWIAVHPESGEAYVTLSNNTRRGLAGQRGADAANPRGPNPFGHIVRWREDGGDAAATNFAWDPFLLAGDPQVAGSDARYPSPAADPFGAPDGLHFDAGGLLWIGTDLSATQMHRGAVARLGNNALLCANPRTGELRRFLTGPRGCELTGCVVSPDRRTLFVNIQHPGETSDSGGSDSRWPDGGRPRSATLAVRRLDGGIVGT